MYRWLRALLFRLDAERSHELAFAIGRAIQAIHPALIAPLFRYRQPMLEQSVCGLRFPGPVGLAAGFDKNARIVRLCQSLGFGHIEVGSVSARPAPGNPRPRAFRLPLDRALINRMGLNNDGAERVAERIAALHGYREVPLGINLAKTHDPDILGDAAIEDFCDSFLSLAPHADYVALNISCPNTREGTTFEDPAALDRLLEAIMHERATLGLAVPVFVKLAPPPAERGVIPPAINEVLAVCRAHGVAGLIATNTASDRAGLRSDAEKVGAIGRGGLSGAPIEERSTRLIRYLYRETGGAMPIIGVGGVDSAEAAYRKLRAGASLVQVYTGLVYEGPGLVKAIHRGLVRALARDGLPSIGAAVGLDA